MRVEPPLPGMPGRLDEEDLAAGRGPGQAGGDARDARAVGHLAEVPRRAEQLGDLRRADRSPTCACPSACFRATLRQIAAISRSRFRRPASRV